MPSTISSLPDGTVKLNLSHDDAAALGIIDCAGMQLVGSPCPSDSTPHQELAFRHTTDDRTPVQFTRVRMNGQGLIRLTSPQRSAQVPSHSQAHSQRTSQRSSISCKVEDHHEQTQQSIQCLEDHNRYFRSHPDAERISCIHIEPALNGPLSAQSLQRGWSEPPQSTQCKIQSPKRQYSVNKQPTTATNANHLVGHHIPSTAQTRPKLQYIADIPMRHRNSRKTSGSSTRECSCRLCESKRSLPDISRERAQNGNIESAERGERSRRTRKKKKGQRQKTDDLTRQKLQNEEMQRMMKQLLDEHAKLQQHTDRVARENHALKSKIISRSRKCELKERFQRNCNNSPNKARDHDQMYAAHMAVDHLSCTHTSEARIQGNSEQQSTMEMDCVSGTERESSNSSIRVSHQEQAHERGHHYIAVPECTRIRPHGQASNICLNWPQRSGDNESSGEMIVTQHSYDGMRALMRENEEMKTRIKQLTSAFAKSDHEDHSQENTRSADGHTYEAIASTFRHNDGGQDEKVGHFITRDDNGCLAHRLGCRCPLHKHVETFKKAMDRCDENKLKCWERIPEVARKYL